MEEVAKNGNCPVEKSAFPTFIDEKKVARIFEISVRTVQQWRLKGHGPPYTKISSLVRYNLEAVLTWAAAQTKKSTSEK